MGNSLPQLYERWAEECLKGPVPEETRAPCLECVMLSHSASDRKSDLDIFFSANTKCCTYMPDLPNFLVGMILADDSVEFAAGRSLFERQVLKWAVISPLGAGRPAPYWAEYVNTFRSFGNNDSMRCPYYMYEQGGLCGIWLYRNSRCTTWFCKYERRSVSVIFWKSMEFLLLSVEKALVQWCILKLGLDADSLCKLFPPGSEPNASVTTSWGSWSGREREFFLECGKLVAELNWDDVRLVAGPELQVREKLLQQAYSSLLNQQMPDRLRRGNFTGKFIGDHTFRVWSYSKYDALDLPEKLYDLLPEFDGRPLNKVLHSIEKNHDLQIGEDWLRKLIDSMILIPA